MKSYYNIYHITYHIAQVIIVPYMSRNIGLAFYYYYNNAILLYAKSFSYLVEDILVDT